MRSHPELAELAAWFRQALQDAGYPSVNAFVQRHPFDKNPVYGLINGTRLLTLEACRAVAVALRRKPDEIDPMWWRAKQAMERSAADLRDGRTVASWAALPWPPAALQDILEAQAQAVDLLPYRLLGVEPPPLSAVYVRQHARTQPAGGKAERPDARPETTTDRESAPLEKAIPVTAALDRHEHLVLTGEPGAGKSTFGQYLALRLSEIWLRTATGEHPPIREPVVPIRVPARTLVGARSWATGLATATQHTLGLRLVAEPQPALFERRLLGVRWLIIVDGLDEIVDRAARTEVIQALAARCRPGSDYRVVVTTRQLPDAEFAMLRSQHVQTYAVEPFGREELRVFADQWFTAQGSAEPGRDAARFLRQTADGRLRELVRNPLLATIAAISCTLDPQRPLPRSRLDLYERFFEHLLDEDTGHRDTLAELRRMTAGRPHRRRFADWLYESRMEVLRHLGRVRLDGDEALLDAAVTWVDANAPADCGRPADRADDVRAVLIGTGLLVYEGDRLRFLHHSFAEFLAAQGHAEGVGADFAGLDAWIAKGIRPAERDFVLFLFAQWCRRPGHDVAAVIDRLLLGDPQRALLAGRLLAELGDQPDPPRAQVLDRLFGLALFHSAREEIGGNVDPASMAEIVTVESDGVGEVLGDFVDDPEVIGRLRSIADDARLPQPTRILAIRALGRCDDVAEATRRLAALAERLRGFDLLTAARAAIALDPNDPLGRALLERVCRETGAYPGVRADAAAELAGLGDAHLAPQTARAQVLDNRLGMDELRRAVETWLAAVPEGGRRADAFAEVLGRITLSARQQASVAEALVKVGLPDQADRLALDALRHLADVGYPAQSLIAAWLRPDHRHLGEVVELIRRTADPRSRAHAVRGLADTGCAEEAAALARELIADPGSDGYTASLAVTSWLTAQGGTALDAVLQTVRGRSFSGVRWFSNVPEALIEAGFPAAATDLVRDSLVEVTSDWWDLSACVSAWLAVSGPEAAPDIVGRLGRPGALSLQARAMVGRALAMHGCLAEADRLTAGLADLPDLGRYELAPVATAAVLTHGRPGAEHIARVVHERDLSSMDRVVVAEHMAAAGHVATAQSMWCSVLTRRSAPLIWLNVAADRMVSTGGTEMALAAVSAHDDPAVTAREALLHASALANETRG